MAQGRSGRLQGSILGALGAPPGQDFGRISVVATPLAGPSVARILFKVCPKFVPILDQFVALPLLPLPNSLCPSVEGAAVCAQRSE